MWNVDQHDDGRSQHDGIAKTHQMSGPAAQSLIAASGGTNVSAALPHTITFNAKCEGFRQAGKAIVLGLAAMTEEQRRREFAWLIQTMHAAPKKRPHAYIYYCSGEQEALLNNWVSLSSVRAWLSNSEP